MLYAAFNPNRKKKAMIIVLELIIGSLGLYTSISCHQLASEPLIKRYMNVMAICYGYNIACV